MNASFAAVLGSRDRSLIVGCLAWVVAVSCAVFPDEATLPERAATSGGDGAIPGAGAANDPPPGGNAGDEGGGAARAGSSASGTSPGGMSSGGVPNIVFEAGAGGMESGHAGGGADPLGCDATRNVTVLVDFDTWIESARPRLSHDKDAELPVVGAPDERRALLQLTLPATSNAEELSRAQLLIHLNANADAARSPRELGLHRLTRGIDGGTSWNTFTNGAVNKWLAPGGDFGPELARASVTAATSTLSFDVTQLVRDAQSSAPMTLAVVILEIGSAPPAPADLAFASLEGDASTAPELVLSYCAP